MIKNFMKKMKEQKGLTLVELLAVIVILGIIAGIAVPSISGIIEKSKTDAHNANIEMIESAGKIAEAAQLAGGSDGYTVAELVTGKYLKEHPTNPLTNAKDYNGVVVNGQYTTTTTTTP